MITVRISDYDIMFETSIHYSVAENFHDVFMYTEIDTIFTSQYDNMMGLIVHPWQVLGSIGGSTFKGGNEKDTPSFSSKHILAQCCIATRQLQSELERLRKSQARTFVKTLKTPFVFQWLV